jgi:AraC-like DNA-binding protein
MQGEANSPSLGVQAIYPLLHQLRRRDLSVHAFLEGFGIGGDALEHPDGRLPLALLDAIWQRGAEATADECVGLHAAEALSAGSFGVLSYLGVTSATLGDALGRVLGHFRLLSDASEYKLELRGGVARLTAHQYVLGPAPVRQRVEFTVGAMFRYCHDFVAGGLVASDVFLEHPAPPHLGEHRRFFGCTPRFSAGESGFTFAASFLERRMRTSDPDLSRILEQHAQRLLAEKPLVETAADRLRTLLMRDGIRARRSLAQSARGLGTSARTLQRWLRLEGTSYRAVVALAKRAAACHLIAEPRIGFEQVAAALGFSEAAPFHRAFKRWTGLTPAAFRHGLLDGPPGSNGAGVSGQLFGAYRHAGRRG